MNENADQRTSIRRELAAIQPADTTETNHRADALAWVDSGATLCRIAKPATPAKHLVSYFALIDASQILLVDHKNAQLWLPAGGHVEPGEHPRTTVLRELKEELGLVPAHPIGSPLMVTCTMTGGLSAGHIDVSLWYVVHASRTAPLVIEQSEFHAVHWFAFAEAPLHRSDPHLGRFIKKLTASRPQIF